MHKHPYFILVLQLISLMFYLVIGQYGGLNKEIEIYWLLILPIYCTYGYTLFIIFHDSGSVLKSFNGLIIFGVLFRLVLLSADPVLSDDVYRYLWDGKIFAAGINPYRFAPMDEHLAVFRDLSVYPYLNFPEIATSYPPVSQFFFLVNQWLGGYLIGWKIILLLVELLLVIVFLKLLVLFRLDKIRLLIFFYNPLVILETYYSGHLELIGIYFFWFAVYFFYKKYDWQSIVLVALAVMTKFFPLVSSLPFMAPRFLRKSLFFLIVCVLLIIPFTYGGTLPLPGLFSYINRWEFNGGLYHLVNSILKAVNFPESTWMTASFSGYVETFYFSTGFYYKVVAVLSFLIIVLVQMKKNLVLSRFRGIHYIQLSFFLTGFFLLVVPTLHPWYLLWIIPFLVFLPRWSWISFTFLIQLSYYILNNYALSGIWEESTWVLLAQYIPFYLLLITEYLDKRKIMGWLA